MTRLLSVFLATLLLTAATAAVVKAEPGDVNEWCWKKFWNC